MRMIFALGAVCLLLSCGSDNSSSDGAKYVAKEAESAKNTPPTATSIDEILDAYEANQIGAAKKYADTPIRLSGKALRVREALGTGFLILRAKKSGREQEFGFSEGGTALLADVSPGDTVTVTCPGVAEGLGMIFIAGCYGLEIG